MRATTVIATGLLTALTACGKPATTTTADHLPARKAGLWIQTLNAHGASGPGAETRICLDAETDARMAAFGQGVGSSMCQQTVSRAADGSYAFSASCKLGDAVSVTTRGVAKGDFSSAYKVHTESDMSGANFPHPIHKVSDIEAHYAGPCPAGMAPGTVTIGNGAVTFNANKMPNLAAALGGH